MFGDSELRSEQRLGRGGAESDDYVGFDNCDLGFKPGTAGSDFQGVRFLVDPAFAARFPFEMFDNIGDVGLFALDAGCFQGVIEQTAGSPTNMTFTRLAPSPKTVCVPVFHRSQAWQSAAAFLSDESDGRGGIKASAGLMKFLFLGI